MTRNMLLDPLISTGNYSAQENTITLFVNNRQLKDILRSFCHELIHHNQRLSYGDERFMAINVHGNLVDNSDLEELEADAYLRGNIMFRKWTEQYRGNGGTSYHNK